MDGNLDFRTGRKRGVQRFTHADVQGNVAIISLHANELKRNGTLGEFEALVTWLRKWYEPDPSPPDESRIV
jgi:hypothetical protein